LLSERWDDQSLDSAIFRHRISSPFATPCLSMASFACGSRRAVRNLQTRPSVISTFGVQSPPNGVLWVQSVHKAWIEISSRFRDIYGRIRQRLNPFHPVALALEKYIIGGHRYRRLIALTEQVKCDLVRLYGVPPEKVDIVPNGFSPHEFGLTRASSLRPAMRQQLGYPDNEKVILFVANELDRKGFGPLLRSIAALGDSLVSLLVVGRIGPGRYTDEIAALGMNTRVRFAGPSNDVAQYYAAADVFALPTEYEAWGLVVIEALASGLPVVTSRLAGAAVAVVDGRTGILLDDPRNVQSITAALGTVLSGSCETADRISESVEPYSWNRVLPRYEQILMECSTKH